jgi:SPP1 family predicted phage head-tail adaptor
VIGDLRVRIRLERPERSADAMGGAAVTFVDAGGAWAAMTPLGAGEEDAFDRVRASARYRFALRMRRDVRPGWRVGLGERRLRILAVGDADDRGARLALLCEEEFL